MRPATAQTANKFLFNLEPALSVSRTSTETRIGDRVEEVYFALISSKHEIGRVRIIRITLRCATSSGNGPIDNCEVAFVLNLECRSHVPFVRLDSGIEPGNGLQVGTFTR